MATVVIPLPDLEGALPADGDAVDVSAYVHKALQIGGTFVATLQPQGSINGVDWVSLGTAITSPTIVPLWTHVTWLRLRAIAYTSGTPTAMLAVMRLA
jgi:hypothetical protein